MATTFSSRSASAIERLGEDRRIARRSRCRLCLDAGHDVELHHAMIFVGGILRGLVALALVRHDMDQHRPDLRIADVFEHIDERFDVVTVDRPDIIETELVEERPAGEQAAGIFLHSARSAVQRFRHRPSDPLRQLARREVLVRADQPGERIAQRSDRRRNGHVVVVEDDDEAVSRRRGIVHSLIGHAGAQCPVADDSHGLARCIGKLVRNCEAEGCGNGR